SNLPSQRPNPCVLGSAGRPAVPHSPRTMPGRRSMNTLASLHGTSENKTRGTGRHAVVIGGSMAGLLAARVLAEHFDRVTVLERDRYPEGPAPRKGTPQARHAHVLLGRGQLILQDLFPGI